MIRAAGLALALVAGAPAVAGSVCDQITDWSGQVAQTGSVTAADGVLTGAPKAPACRRSLAMSGAQAIHCAWAFGYRDPAARQTFDVLLGQLEGCFGPEIDGPKKSEVNHPDSYALRQFDLAGDRLAISLKDKGGLQETYIFLRLSRLPE